eukprot:scaffold15503_cov114-Isochrysis_galbana.AAC.1
MAVQIRIKLGANVQASDLAEHEFDLSRKRRKGGLFHCVRMRMPGPRGVPQLQVSESRVRVTSGQVRREADA